jgi:hypothetical protein
MNNKGHTICNNTGKEVPSEWLQELQKAIDASYSVLKELEKSGYQYKCISQVVLDNTSNPFWAGESETTGCVHMNPFKHDARAIAHEIGHGFEERWRKDTSEIMGQSMAEAIRFFVEQKMGSSSWKPQNEWRVVLDMCCENFYKFTLLLGTEELHNKYS